MYTACQQCFHALAELEMKIADVKGVKRGRLRLAVITSAKYVAPYLLGQFHRQHPGIDISLEVANREQLLGWITNHEHDLYIMGEPPREIDVEAYPLVPNPLVVMASRDHPLVHVPNIPLKRLLDEHFIMRETGSGTRAAVVRLFESKGLTPPEADMEFANNEAIKQAISAGLGISVLSLHALVLEGTSGPIALLDVQGFPIKRQWYLVHPKGKKLSVVARSFLELVREQGQHIAEKFDRELAELHRARPVKTKKHRDARGGGSQRQR